MRFFGNPEIGKDRSQLEREIDEVDFEAAGRRANNLDTEDQEARAANLRAARGMLQ